MRCTIIRLRIRPRSVVQMRFVSNIRRRKERELVHWVLGERGEDCLVVWWWDLPSGVFEWEWES